MIGNTKINCYHDFVHVRSKGDFLKPSSDSSFELSPPVFGPTSPQPLSCISTETQSFLEEFVEWPQERSIGVSCIGPNDLKIANDLSYEKVSAGAQEGGDLCLSTVGDGEEVEELEDSDKIVEEVSGSGGLKGIKGSRVKFCGGGCGNDGFWRKGVGKKGKPEE